LSVHWLSEETISFEIDIGVYKKICKNVTLISRRNHASQPSCKLLSPWWR